MKMKEFGPPGIPSVSTNVISSLKETIINKAG